MNPHLNNLLLEKTNGNTTGWNINCTNGVWDEGKWFKNYDYHVCKNWFGWSNQLGSIDTTLQGNGKARHLFGNCHDHGHVDVLLDGDKIASANAHVNNKEVEFYFKNGTQLAISEKGGIIQINSLEIIECDNCS